MIKSKINHYLIFTFTTILLIVIPWIGNGYLLTLDMVFGTHIDVYGGHSGITNNLLLYDVLNVISNTLGGVFTQNFLIILIFFFIIFFPLIFFSKIFKNINTNGAEYAVSLLYTFNPFVYERFLAGHWMVLFGYSLLFPIFYYFIELYREYNIKKIFVLALLISILSYISIHTFTIVIVITFITTLYYFIFNKNIIETLKKISILALSCLVLCSFWLIPMFNNKSSNIDNFDNRHWEVFKTTGDNGFETISNIVSLRGFWLEREVWSERFVMQNSLYYKIIFLPVLLIIIYGVYNGVKNESTKKVSKILLLLLSIAIIFSSGIAPGIFKNINYWLFENIGFWKGFRDTQKWSSIIAIIYSLYFGLGISGLLTKYDKYFNRGILLSIFILLPILYTPSMLFGFSNQLKTVNYPDSWYEVNEIIKGEVNCRALFLPWHQYYELKFNNSILTGNISRNFFDCDILHGKNMELGNIKSQGGNGDEYNELETIVIDNNLNKDRGVEKLKKFNIKYIIFTDDIMSLDEYYYPFLDSFLIKEIYKKDGIYLFKVI